MILRSTLPSDPKEHVGKQPQQHDDGKCNLLASGPYLPEEEVTEAHLPGGSDKEVGVRGVTAVQTLTEQGLGHVATPQREEKS